MNIDRWLAGNRASRAQDTVEIIDDQPVVVAWFRKGASLGYLTVRIDAANTQPRHGRTPQSESDEAAVTVIAADDVPLRADDRLQADGGIVYTIAFVNPKQDGITTASAYVGSQ